MNKIFSAQEQLTPQSICFKSRAEGDIFVVLTGNGDIEFLNETASFFYSKVDGSKNIKQIYQEMMAAYDVTSTQLQEDLVELLRSFQWRRIIRLEL